MPPQSVPSVVTPPWRHVLWLIFAMVCVSPGARACDSGSVIGPGQSGLGGGIPDSAVVHGITGAGGIADLCMGFSDIYPQANAYWENTLSWVVATAVDMGGGHGLADVRELARPREVFWSPHGGVECAVARRGLPADPEDRISGSGPLYHGLALGRSGFHEPIHSGKTRPGLPRIRSRHCAQRSLV